MTTPEALIELASNALMVANEMAAMGIIKADQRAEMFEDVLSVMQGKIVPIRALAQGEG